MEHQFPHSMKSWGSHNVFKHHTSNADKPNKLAHVDGFLTAMLLAFDEVRFIKHDPGTFGCFIGGHDAAGKTPVEALKNVLKNMEKKS